MVLGRSAVPRMKVGCSLGFSIFSPELQGTFCPRGCSSAIKSVSQIAAFRHGRRFLAVFKASGLLARETMLDVTQSLQRRRQRDSHVSHCSRYLVRKCDLQYCAKVLAPHLDSQGLLHDLVEFRFSKHYTGNTVGV